MVATMISWPHYRLGEPPPVCVDCPLHLGQILPCPVCLEWLRDGRVALAGQQPGQADAALLGACPAPAVGGG